MTAEYIATTEPLALAEPSYLEQYCVDVRIEPPLPDEAVTGQVLDETQRRLIPSSKFNGRTPAYIAEASVIVDDGTPTKNAQTTAETAATKLRILFDRGLESAYIRGKWVLIPGDLDINTTNGLVRSFLRQLIESDDMLTVTNAAEQE